MRIPARKIIRRAVLAFIVWLLVLGAWIGGRMELASNFDLTPKGKTPVSEFCPPLAEHPETMGGLEARLKCARRVHDGNSKCLLLDMRARKRVLMFARCV